MANQLRFVVPGIPVSKGRPRVTFRGTFTPKKTKDHERAIQMFARSAMQQVKMTILEGSVSLWVICYGAHPLSDWDNLGKAVSDALNGVAWKDDRQVISAKVDKVKCEKGQERTIVYVYVEA